MDLKKAVGSQGSWFAKVDGVLLPCAHKHWWPNGVMYHDPFKNYVGDQKRVSDYANAITSAGCVIITDDEAVLDENGDVLVFRRSKYIGVFEVADVSYSATDGIRFRVVRRLYSLRP